MIHCPIQLVFMSQSLSDIWLAERKNRMTASSMKDWACNAIKKANNIWKPPADLGHVRSIDWGVSHEQLARSEYEKKTGNVVTSVGLCISRKYPVLAASPDGIMDTKVLEIKCCLLYTSPSPRDLSTSRMPSSA